MCVLPLVQPVVVRTSLWQLLEAAGSTGSMTGLVFCDQLLVPPWCFLRLLLVLCSPGTRLLATVNPPLGSRKKLRRSFFCTLISQCFVAPSTFCHEKSISSLPRLHAAAKAGAWHFGKCCRDLRRSIGFSAFGIHRLSGDIED
jgi:hypothetical protein